MIRVTEAEYARMIGKGMEKPKKYRNRKCEWRGIRFDSVKERDRFIFLDSERAAGRITNLLRQVKFQLVPAQWIDGKQVEKEVSYIADFVYCDPYGKTVVEDVKGGNATKTREYVIKRKLMLERYGVRIQEV